ncbi:hypothetical protein [Chitinimonas naiadis]
MKLPILMFTFLASLAAGFVQAADANAWVQGTWQLAEDKKNPGATDDFMDFAADGTVKLRDSKAVYAICTYAPSAQAVLLTCIVRGKEKPLLLKASADKKALINPQGDVYRKAR